MVAQQESWGWMAGKDGSYFTLKTEGIILPLTRTASTEQGMFQCLVA